MRDAHARGVRRARQIVRTASFSRRSKRDLWREDENATEPESSAASRSGDESPADPNSPTEAASAPEAAPPEAVADDEPEAPSILQERLYGWLKKRSSSGGSWKKRYFFVDETRGTLGYAKSARGRGSKPSAVLPIADITRIEPFAGEPCAFVIACPPIHLTVCAISVKERKVWMKQLEMRCDVWRVRQAQKMPVANVGALLKEASSDAAKGRRPLSLRSAPSEPPPPSPPVQPTSAARAAHQPGASLVPRHPVNGYDEFEASALPARGSSPKRAPSPALDLSAGDTEPYLPAHAPYPSAEDDARAALPAGAPESLFVPVAPPKDVRGSGARENAPIQVCPSPTRASRKPSAPVDETIEFDSGAEDGDDDSPVGSANRASGGRRRHAEGASPPMRCAAPVPLAAMISSDEDEDEDEQQPQQQQSDHHRQQQQQPVAAPHMGSYDDERDDERAPVDVPRPAPTQPDEVPASHGGWDSEPEEDTRDAYNAHDGHRAEHHIDEYHADADDDDAGPPPDAPRIEAAPGIAADTNFAEDDWDDDDM
jgi:hypothetical protein